MIYEIAQIKIDPSRAESFEAAVAKSAVVFKNAKGCHGMRLEKIIEDEALYRLVVTWETVEDHMVTFRESEDFQVWRSNAGPFFLEPPVVNHASTVGDFF